MKSDIPKAYEANKVEDEIYRRWEASGFFNPDNALKRAGKSAGVFSLMMPPPNVTGVLHLGHALENSLMDIVARYQRMQGKKTLFLPGTDHAAVATQSRVEADLIESGKYKNPRQELGREKLLKIIRDYAANSQKTIIRQIKKLGASCDWSRLAYTFDNERSRAVNTIFKKMYDDGLIYRGYRVVNWSVKGQSTCSDDELVYVERKAKLWTFKYTKDFPIAIATTRPETKLGDTAVAINPKDKRYGKYLGQIFTVDVGAIKPLKIKIIADEGVDTEFGTGALGVTPAHSPTDYEIYEKQKAKGEPIDLIPVIGVDGKMTENAGKEYQGLIVEKAREKFVKYLQQQGLLEKEEEIVQNVGTSDRFKDAVEALPMEQWFVNVNKKIPGKGKSLKDLMREAVISGHNGDSKQKVEINPKRFHKSYLMWIDNLRDWCISRQIWWGHRIPVWYSRGASNDDKIKVQSKSPEAGWVQDPDTLDTWFSSGLWTFSTLGWPDKTDDLKIYHPTSWMQMGYEILFFWMARMILMSTYALDEIPFKAVYIHGMLRDKQGRKFSKSEKTGTDPLKMIEKYGADALRLSLILGISPGNDSRFYQEKIQGTRNFVNKFWNIGRYIITSSNSKVEVSNFNTKFKNLTLADHWMLSRLNTIIEEVTDYLEKYEFSQAGEKLRNFTWNEFADWYIEVKKIEKNNHWLLVTAYWLLLKMWHPFMPFVTEEMNKQMGYKDLLMIQKWPKEDKGLIYKESEEDFQLIKDIITAIRNARAVYRIEPAKKIPAIVLASGKVRLLKEHLEIIKNLARLESLDIKSKTEKLSEAINLVVGGVEIYLLVGSIIDIEQEKFRIGSEIKKVEKYLNSLKKKLKNKDFLEKAPKEIMEKEKINQGETEKKLEKLKEQIENLK